MSGGVHVGMAKVHLSSDRRDISSPQRRTAPSTSCCPRAHSIFEDDNARVISWWSRESAMRRAGRSAGAYHLQIR
jgi:hypothetical protein